MYLTPAGAFWLFLGSFILERPKMIANDAFAFVAAHPVKFATAAMMGFAVNSLGYIVIKSASSLTLKVLGTVKNAFVVWCGIFFLNETVTKLQGFGYGIAIVAFYWYQKLKMEQLRGDAPNSLITVPEYPTNSVKMR
jgi:Triose-phosphate Transporter family